MLTLRHIAGFFDYVKILDTALIRLHLKLPEVIICAIDNNKHFAIVKSLKLSGYSRPRLRQKTPKLACGIVLARMRFLDISNPFNK